MFYINMEVCDLYKTQTNNLDLSVLKYTAESI